VGVDAGRGREDVLVRAELIIAAKPVKIPAGGTRPDEGGGPARSGQPPAVTLAVACAPGGQRDGKAPARTVLAVRAGTGPASDLFGHRVCRVLARLHTAPGAVRPGDRGRHSREQAVTSLNLTRQAGAVSPGAGTWRAGRSSGCSPAVAPASAQVPGRCCHD
jgi:hypothetical protein